MALGGLAAGFAFSAKYTGAAALAGVLLAILVMNRISRLAFAKAAVACTGFLLAAAPWIVGNWATFGNPVFPFLNSVFPSPYIHVDWEVQYLKTMRTFNGVTWPEIPLELTLKGDRLTGLIGPIFLLAPLALWPALRTRAGRYVGMWLLLWAAVYTSNIGARFFIPALFFLSLLLAAVFRWTPLAAGLVIAHAVLSWPANLPLYCAPYAYRIDMVQALRAVTFPNQSDYLLRDAGFRAAKFVEANTPPGSLIFGVTSADRAYTTRTILPHHQSARAELAQDVLLSSARLERVGSIVCSFRVPVRRMELTGRAAQAVEFSLTEIGFYRGESAVSGITASSAVNRWELARAFDNNLATRWRSWTRDRNAALSFSAKAEFDRVVIWLPTDEDGSRWTARGEGKTATCADAAWTHTPPADIPLGLEALGITHVFLDRSVDFSKHFIPALEKHLTRHASAESLEIYQVRQDRQTAASRFMTAR